MAVASSDTTISLGETAVLTCIGYAIPLIEMSWMHNGRTLENSTSVMIMESDILLGGARFRQSVLQICGVGQSESGTYTCFVTNTQIEIDAFIELNVFGKYHKVQEGGGE